jgi:FlaA1/EpsC-like NDP-sugar epimerase
MVARAPDFSTISASESRLRDRLINLPRHQKQLMMLFTDAAGFFGCLVLCGWLDLINPVFRTDALLLVAVVLTITHLLARYLGFYHSIVRYLGMGLLIASVRVAVGSALTLAVLTWYTGLTTLPFRLAVVYGAFCGLYLVGSRYTAQFFLLRRTPGRHNVIVYGAGEAGARVAQAMQGSAMNSIVAFVDDNPSLTGKVLAGVHVHPRSDLERLITEKSVSSILLAVPSASRKERASIVESLEQFSVHVQTIPDLNDIVSGRSKVDELREVGVEDILGRDAVDPDPNLMRATITNKSVMVTGAGGSIGSELCRQIVRLKPARLVLFEISEPSLYAINKELRTLSKKLDFDCEIVAILGSVGNEAHVREVMLSFGVDTAYHAAAYKHVPMVERNMLAGVDNNIFGTLNAARAALAAKVDTFVLVSTDKAVSPPNVMGATKRFAELILQAIQDDSPDTTFCMVRFGNVLESSGSVVPLFREQIRAGGPVTVTHPQIIRYFMTIPEAAQLVIQAGAMAKGGDVFVLDMGQPVRILDLAERLIRLTGLTVKDVNNPDGDIEIEFTGLRPAEKLYEELLIGDNATGTRHPRIMRAQEDYLPLDLLQQLLDELATHSRERDRIEARQVLKRVVAGYAPTNGIDDAVWANSRDSSADESGGNVVKLPTTG